MVKVILRTPKERRKKRVSSRYFGTKERPRIYIFRSNKYLYAQVICDEEKKVITSIFTKKKVSEAEKLGLRLAELLLKKGIKKVIFDRGPYAYHGRVAAVAEGLRKGGIIV